jgi:branched-chain amino acid transport system permease protein
LDQGHTQEFIQHLINGISLGSIYALIALGYTMVYGISPAHKFRPQRSIYGWRVRGLLHGATVRARPTSGSSVAICSAVLRQWLRAHYWESPSNDLPIDRFERLRSSTSLITAIGVSLLLQYSGQIIFGADPKLFPEVIKDSSLFEIGSVEVRSLDITILIVSTLVMGGLHFLVHHTKIGTAMRAVSSNSNVASLMGINVDRIITYTFVIGSSLAGIASVLVGLKYPKIDPLMGMLFGIKAFVAAVLGGIGSLPGSDAWRSDTWAFAKKWSSAICRARIATPLAFRSLDCHSYSLDRQAFLAQL